jgi:hypothetical protein
MMKEPLSYYAGKMIELQKAQNDLYQEWLKRQEGIFEQYLRAIRDLLESQERMPKPVRMKARRRRRKTPPKRKKAPEKSKGKKKK